MARAWLGGDGLGKTPAVYNLHVDSSLGFENFICVVAWVLGVVLAERRGVWAASLVLGGTRRQETEKTKTGAFIRRESVAESWWISLPKEETIGYP